MKRAYGANFHHGKGSEIIFHSERIFRLVTILTDSLCLPDKSIFINHKQKGIGIMLKSIWK